MSSLTQGSSDGLSCYVKASRASSGVSLAPLLYFHSWFSPWNHRHGDVYVTWLFWLFRCWFGDLWGTKSDDSRRVAHESRSLLYHAWLGFSPLSASITATWSLYFAFSRKSIQFISGFIQSPDIRLRHLVLAVIWPHKHLLKHLVGFSVIIFQGLPPKQSPSQSTGLFKTLLCLTWILLPLSCHAGAP